MPDRADDLGPGMVTHHLRGNVVGDQGLRPLELALHYDSGSPYAVTATFDQRGTSVSWSFGRDLLRDGVYEPVGAGDVHVRPDLDDQGRAVVRLELFSPHGAAIVTVPSRDIHEFVVATTDTVGPGTESRHLDIDAAIAVLVGRAAD